MRNFIFIVLEGIDRCGKSSVTNILSTKLNAEVYTFPERKTKIGQILDSYLTSKENFAPQVSHLLFSANRWEFAEKIEKTLETKAVVCDRYYYSGIVYSLLNGLELDWASQADKGLPEPDLVAFIDINPELIVEREGFGDERYDSVQMQSKVYNLYKSLFLNKENVKFFNGSKNTDEIAQDIYDFIITED